MMFDSGTECIQKQIPKDKSLSINQSTMGFDFPWTWEIFNLAACMLVILAADQTIVRINKRSCEILGYDEGEVMGKNWFDTFHSENHCPALKNSFTRVITGKIPLKEFYENSIRTKCGEKRLIRWHNTLIRNKEGQILGTISSGEDVTDQRKMEAALRDSERNAYVLLNATFDAVFLVDVSSHVIIAANEEFAHRFNTTAANVLGYRIDALVSPESFPERFARARQTIDGGLPVTFIDQRDNIWLEHHYYPVRDDQGQVVCLAIFSRDITGRIQAEQALKEREEELRCRTEDLMEANAALNVLLKNINEEKKRLGETISANFHEAVLPYLDMLKKSQVDHWGAKCLGILEANINNILSPFLKQAIWQHEDLTPMELQVAQLIREGKSAKEIADLLHVGVGTINTHCHNIRKKLGLNHGKVGLRSFLRTVTS
jgi:PAS domain S-box-containing protein